MLTRVLDEIAALDREGRREEALARVSHALATTPDNPDLLFARGTILFRSDRFFEAVESYTMAESNGLRMQGGSLDLQLGWCYLNTGEAELAASHMQAAVAAEPQAAETQFGDAMSLFARRRYRDAEKKFLRAIELQPDNIDAMLGAGKCRFETNDFPAAESLYRQAVVCDGTHAMAWALLGAAVNAQDRFAEAHGLFQHAMALEIEQDRMGDSFQNVAICLRDFGRRTEALDLFEKYLPTIPSVHASIGYAVALLISGRLAEAWPYYEFRWLQGAYLATRPTFGRPAWMGQDLHGKVIVLRAEQGLGDFIQFIRYARWIKALGARVVVIAPPPLLELTITVAGVDAVVGPADPLPHFDYFAHLLSLPGVFGTELSTIPQSGPYFRADSRCVKHWAHRIVARDGELKVGVAWAGSPTHLGDRQRSIPLATLGALGGLSGVRYFSLQKGPREVEAMTSLGDWISERLGPELQDMSDTAAVISHLDLVICVDTAVAHLAAALGKPVWMLIPTPPDFRWLEEREDTVWYPTMRLFRQRTHGDWEEVVARVRIALQILVANGGTAALTRTLTATESPARTPPNALARDAPGHRRGMSGVAETRHGILQYFPDEPDVGDSLGWYGEWLEPQLALLASVVQPGSTLLELGSGIGAHAIRLAQGLGHGGHLLAAESSSATRRVLRQNLAAHQVVGATVLPDAAVTVDGLWLERLAWLKVMEPIEARAVVEGASATLWRLRPRLFLAAANDQALSALGAELRSFGYRCWRIETALYNANNFNRRDGDIFGGRTALALLAIPEESDPGMALAGYAELSLT